MSERLLIFILSYKAENLIEKFLADIPPEFLNQPHIQILLIDDASTDRSFEVAQEFIKNQGISNAKALKNLHNQGFGGNQKVGFRYALTGGFETVAVLHVNGSHWPHFLPPLLNMMKENKNVRCVLGVSQKNSLKGKCLSTLQSKLGGTPFSDWNGGIRVYRTAILNQVAFELNTNRFHFNTELLLELLDVNTVIVEKKLPLERGKNPTHINFFKYAKDVLKASLKYRLQKYNLFYDIRFHPELVSDKTLASEHGAHYQEKFDSLSPHSAVCFDANLVPPQSKVLDIGCSTGYVAHTLTQNKQCQVTGVDIIPASKLNFDSIDYHQIDLENNSEAILSLLKTKSFDRILMLDVLEHLSSPELFLLNFYKASLKNSPRFIFSTANVAFFMVRFMLLLGQFNYGAKGILDITHKRLFSYRTFKNLLEQTGFLIQAKRFFPFPFRALGLPIGISGWLEKLNLFLIKLSPSLFAYQIMLEALPLSSPESVLQETLQTKPASLV